MLARRSGSIASRASDPADFKDGDPPGNLDVLFEFFIGLAAGRSSGSPDGSVSISQDHHAPGAAVKLVEIVLKLIAFHPAADLKPAESESHRPRSPRLDEMFRLQASATPEAAAIVYDHQVSTYTELGDAVSKAAQRLTDLGVGPGVLVAVSLSRTPRLIIALLAILEAGGAYLPLDVRHPPERLRFLLSDSGAAAVIVDHAAPVWDAFGGAVFSFASDELVRTSGERLRPRAASRRADLAYVIYTSGSAGVPKGVMLGHGATHLVDWARDAYPQAQRARVAFTTSISFDPSIFEIFMPLCTGGTVLIKENGLDPFSMDEQPTMLDVVPSVLRELCRSNAIPRSIEVLNVGGEKLSADLVPEVYRQCPALTLFNHYGPTEATTCATVAQVPPDLIGEPSIGRPVRGAVVCVLDAAGSPAREGEVGEIHIGGPGLALGYLGQPELTASRFPETPSGRLFRTGDLGIRRSGELYFAGRLDRQVKVRGVRIELGEVEKALLRVDGVEDAIVEVGAREGGGTLSAYVQTQPDRLTASELRNAIAAWLPGYMLPNEILICEQLPRLLSGKIDVAALRTLQELGSSDRSAEASRHEAPIIHAFEEVLGRSGIGPDDSFFDSGGDSLLSVRAALRLEELLGQEVPAALIHQAATPRSLARALGQAQGRATRHIALLTPGGPAAPLFCMADLFGTAFNYLSLAKRLASERPVFGVVPGPLQDSFTRDGDLSAMTRSIVTELRQLQPCGPYLIAGHSAGGLLAVDLAAALEREGDEVRLVLLDAYSYARRPSSSALAVFAVKQARRVLRSLGRRVERSVSEPLISKVARRLLPGRPPDWVPRSQMAFAARMLKTGVTERPSIVSGPTLLIKATERDPIDDLFDEDSLLGWSGALQGEVTTARVAGGHYTFMRNTHVAETASAIANFLNDLA